MNLRRALLPLVVAGIAFATLVPSGEATRRLVTCVFCDIRSIADFIANLILFAPLGAALAIRQRSWKSAVIFGALFSAIIETTQYFFVPGRHASVTDVLANAAGVIIGYGIIWWRPLGRARQFGWDASIAFALLVSGLLVGGLFLLKQSLSHPRYDLHWTARYEGHDYYEGKVLDTRIGPMEWVAPQPLEPGDSVRELLRRYPIEARFIAGPLTRRLAPIISIHDGASREIIQLGADREDLIFRYWALADELLLDHADLRFEGVFADASPGDTIDLSLRFAPAGYCLRWNDREYCGRGFTIGDTWSLLISPDWSNSRSRAAGLVWLLLVFVPLGFLVANWRVLGLIAVLTAAALFVGPLLIGFAATPWHQVATALAGLLLGHVFAGWLVPRRDYLES